MPNLPSDFPGAAIALICGITACIMIAATATWAARTALRVWHKVSVAQELLDVHALNLEQRGDQLAATMATAGETGGRLTDNVADLRSSSRELRFLVREVPRARQDLMRIIADLVLPTHDDADDKDEARAGRITR